MSEAEPIVVTFPGLYKAARRFVQEGLHALKTRYGSQAQWPTYPFLEAAFIKAGTGFATQTFPVERPWPAGLVWNYWASDLSKLATFQEAEDELRKLAGDGRAIGHGAPDIGMAYLSPMLGNCLDASKTLEFDEEKFYKAYMPIEAYLSSDEVQSRLFFELSGLRGAVSEVILSPSHRIVELDETLARHIWGLTQRTDFPLTSIFAQTRRRTTMTPGQIILESTIRTPKSEMNKLSVALSVESSRSALSLRLCKAGCGPVLFVDYEHIGFVPSLGRVGFLEELRRGIFSYPLDESTGDQIRKMWALSYEFSGEVLEGPENVPLPIEIAAKRFMTSFEKNSREDRLLDHVIAIEALYGREDTDISYRVPLRAAAVLGTNPADRREIFEMVRSAYGARSEMAHGQGKLGASIKVGNKKVPLGEFLLRIQDSLVQSIHLSLRLRSQNVKKQELLKAIDTAVLTQDRAELEKLIGT